MFQLFALLACGKQPSTSESGLPSVAETETETETEIETTAEAWNHAVHTLEVAGRDEGFDLDDDGDGDNAIWLLGVAIDPLVAAQIMAASRVLVIQTVGRDDSLADIGAFGAEDTDGDPTDNFSGDETFDAGSAVDEQGLARVSVETTLTDGTYEVVLASDTLSVGDLSVEATTPLHLRGGVDAATHTGTLGFGASVEALVTAATALGADAAVVDQLEALADLDTDGDGVPDAISTAWTFEAVACEVSP